MKALKINSTAKTPEVNFNSSLGIFCFSGISVPENALEFYAPILKWLNEYIDDPLPETRVVFKLSYVNTSSLQSLYDIFLILDSIHKKKSVINIEWHYHSEDTDMKEIGEDYREALSIDFSFVEVETV